MDLAHMLFMKKMHSSFELNFYQTSQTSNF